MECRLLMPSLANTPTVIIAIIRIYNLLIAILNITGKAILLWGLGKTGQTSTISFKFIISMSISDLISGISGLTLITLYTWEHKGKSCWQALSTQFILWTCNVFSLLMIVLVAFDRYLHMKHLERYCLVATKKRGYIMAMVSFFAALSMSIVSTVPQLSNIIVILLTVNCTLLLPTLFLVFWLYYSAMRELRIKANQLTRNIIMQSKILGGAA